MKKKTRRPLASGIFSSLPVLGLREQVFPQSFLVYFLGITVSKDSFPFFLRHTVTSQDGSRVRAAQPQFFLIFFPILFTQQRLQRNSVQLMGSGGPNKAFLLYFLIEM